MSSTLRFGFNIDRDFFFPFYHRFLFAYGGAILVVHVVAFYLLLLHSSAWARGVRAGYLLNQMLAHDLWTCFIARPYTLLPYPGILCSGPVCPYIGGFNAYTIENVFMVHSVCVFLFMLIIMHQQIMPPTSKYVISKRSRLVLITALYVGLSLNPIAAFLTGKDPPNIQQILERDELRWIKEITEHVALFGDIGDCGDYKYAVYIIILSIVSSGPIRIFLTVTTIRFLKKQVVITSKAMRMKRLIIAVLIKQTAYSSFFYIYPLLLNGIAHHFQIAFLPDFLLAVVRAALVITYMLNTTAQFIVMISANKSFRTVLQTKVSVLLGWCKLLKARVTPPLRNGTAAVSVTSVRGVSVQTQN